MRTAQGYRRRIRHYEAAGDARYLTFSCFRNQEFLRSERACRWLVESIADARQAVPFDLWAWVFMPQHVHLLIRPAVTTSIGAVLKKIKEPVSKRVAAWVRCNAPDFVPRMMDIQPNGRKTLRFWQPGPGYDRNLFSPQELREKIDYIHRNPLRRSLVRQPADWTWSSFHAWESGKDEPLPIDRGSLPPLA
jgi:putative transposase